MTNSNITDWEYAKQGINLWLNNSPIQAEAHFKIRENDNRIFAGYAFTTVMNAVISYETDKIEHAQNMLKELERRCSNDSSWIYSFKTRFFGTPPNNTKPLIESLEEKIILADSLMCSAILTFLTQDIGGLMRGSWLLRKAWKIYQQTYNQIYEIYKYNSINEEIDIIRSEGTGRLVEPVTPIETISTQQTPQEQNYSFTSHINTSMKRSQTNILNSNNLNIVKDKEDTFLQHYRKSLNQIQTESSTNPRTVFANIPKTTNLKIYFDNLKNSTSNSERAECSTTSPKVPSSSNHPSNRNNLFLNLNSIEKSKNGFNPQVPFSCPEPIPSPYTRLPPLVMSNIDLRVIKRLMGAVSFGYGMFLLSVSLLPPNLLRLISFFGFVGNKDIGISCLMYSKSTEDMRAPLSMLALLWYYTIGAQLFHVDGNTVENEIQLAKQILKESQTDYATSAIFLFFRGRLKRIQCKINIAIDCYDAAYRMSVQKELKLLCLHEVGWCRLIQLDFGNAMLHFHELKLASNFSKIFYTYMTTICQGAFGRFDNLIQLKMEIIDMINKTGHKETQINKFILRRINKLPSSENQNIMFNEIYWKFFIYEMLFLWNTLCSCATDTMSIIISDCSEPNMISKEPSIGLADLILGSCKAQQRNFTEAIQAYRKCIEKRENITEDVHLSAFACYELAMILIKEQTELGKQEAKTILNEAQRAFKNYDFENRLSTRIYSALRSLQF